MAFLIRVHSTPSTKVQLHQPRLGTNPTNRIFTFQQKQREKGGGALLSMAHLLRGVGGMNACEAVASLAFYLTLIAQTIGSTETRASEALEIE